MAGVKQYSTDCSEGINQNKARIRRHQCADALNVWAPEGFVIQRPGFVGISGTPGNLGGAVGGLVERKAYEDVSTTPPTITTATAANALDLNDADTEMWAAAPPPYTADQVGDHWYMGFTAAGYATAGFFGFSATAAAANGSANAAKIYAEYWNGTSWVHLPVNELYRTLLTPPADGATDVSFTTTFDPQNHLETAGIGTRFLFVPPGDWALSSITDTGTSVAYSAHWLRMKLVDVSGAGALDPAVQITNVSAVVASGSTAGLFVARFPTGKRYISVATDGASISYASRSALLGSSNKVWLFSSVGAVGSQPPSMAVVPQLGEAFIAYSRRTTLHRLDQHVDDDAYAKVESSDWAVGPGAAWDKDAVPQLAGWPLLKLISFFQGRLWGIDENDNLRWTAAAPFHKVWPGTAVEPLPEGDASPATGLLPMHETMVVYKEDSIWLAAFRDFDEWGVPHFVPRRQVAGIGSVAHAAIKEIRKKHVFPGDEGLYEFDGNTARDVTIDQTTGVKRMEKFFKSITPGKRSSAVAAHWRKYHCYLLSVSVNGSEFNNRVLVWDYIRDTFWVWSGFTAQFFMGDEGGDDNEVISFGDQYGMVYELDVADHDHGTAIDSWVETRRLGFKEKGRKTFTEVEITSENSSDLVTAKVGRNSEPIEPLSATNLQLRDTVVEAPYGTKLMGGAMDYVSERTRTINVRREADHVKVRVAGSGKGKPFVLHSVLATCTVHDG